MVLKIIGLSFLGIILFISTYLRTYLNGDDIVHFSRMEVKNWYFPYLEKSWIPNRVFDQYFRTLDVNIFDFLYFFQSTLFGVSFFEFFKIYTASIYSVFILLALVYFLRHRPKEETLSWDKIQTITIFIIGLLAIFPWVNHTHLLAYQVPSFLCFIFLHKLIIKDCKSEQLLSFLLLGFICAFTLEAYSAIILIVLLWSLFLSNYKDYRIALLITITFNLLALGVMIKFSQRSSIGVLSFANIFAMIQLVIVSKGFLFMGILSVLCIPLFRIFKLISPAFLMVIFSSVFVTFLISLVTHNNYFSFKEYPWASTLNIAFLCLLFITPQVLSEIRGLYFRFISTLMILIFLSGVINIFLSQSIASGQYSNKLRIFYKAVSSGGVANYLEEGGSLTPGSFAMQVRPLPTFDSPEWFKQSYSVVFKKYVQNFSEKEK